MKVVILAGGLGTRLSEYTKTIPKPMVLINGKPMLLRIMNYFYNQGFKNFYIALGYKGNVIKNYFKKNKKDWDVKLIDTGKNTMTGGRLKRLTKYLKNDRFIMTYGDGLSNVNLKKLIKFHKQIKKQVTLTAVRPKERYGILKIKNNRVTYFDNQNKKTSTYINGGYFVIDKNSIKKINNSKIYFEQGPLNYFAKKKKLLAFKHEGFWKSLDTLKDKNDFNILYKNKKKSPWTI